MPIHFEGQATQADSETKTAPAIGDAIAKISADARIGSQEYLEETKVPHGGE